MREIKLPLEQASLADAFGDIRKWLDHHECVPVDFDITREKGGALVVRMVFAEDEMGSAFDRAFKSAEK